MAKTSRQTKVDALAVRVLGYMRKAGIGANYLEQDVLRAALRISKADAPLSFEELNARYVAFVRDVHSANQTGTDHG